MSTLFRKPTRLFRIPFRQPTQVVVSYTADRTLQGGNTTAVSSNKHRAITCKRLTSKDVRRRRRKDARAARRRNRVA